MNRILRLLAGWTADIIGGDPAWLPHPVVGFGRLIAFGEKHLNRGGHRIAKGALLSIALILLTWVATQALLQAIHLASVSLGATALLPEISHGGEWMPHWMRIATCSWDLTWPEMIVEAVLIFFCLAGTTLIREVRETFRATDRSLEEGRAQVARIVGRDTSQLTAQEVRTAALETLAENLNDGVIAPLFWLALLGIPGMVTYKMINTLDSMIGYRTERYLLFGRVAAKIDDAAGWIPARLTTLLMLLVAGRLHLIPTVHRNGCRHLSPNSGHPEAALAAILDCQFGGTHVYFGERIEKPTIGDNPRELTTADMHKAVRINRLAETAMVLLTAAAQLAISL